MISIYVAGASKEPERVARWFLAIQIAPRMSLTFNWLQAIEQHDDGTVSKAQNAKDDLEGVVRADVLWILRPSNHSTGAWTELGIALGCMLFRDDGRRREIVISGPGHFNIFVDHLEGFNITRCATDEEAWTLLQGLAHQS